MDPFKPITTLPGDLLPHTAREAYDKAKAQVDYPVGVGGGIAVTDAEALTNAGLAEVIGDNLYVRKVSPHYSHAEGRGSNDVVVYAAPNRPERSGGYPNLRSLPVIATWLGTNIDYRPGEGMSFLRCKHPTAADFEHSAVHLGYSEMTDVTLAQIGLGGRTILSAILHQHSYYPMGADPFAPDDEDGPYSDYRPGRCDQCPSKHLYGRYMPTRTINTFTRVYIEYRTTIQPQEEQ